MDAQTLSTDAPPRQDGTTEKAVTTASDTETSFTVSEGKNLNKVNGKQHKEMADQLLRSEIDEDEEEPVGNKNVVSQPDGSDWGTSTSENVRKTIFGIVIVVGIAFSWVGATQFSQSTYSPDFSSASVNVWFSTSWMLVCYPVYVIGCLVVLPRSRSGAGLKTLHRDAEGVFGSRGLCLRTFLSLTVPFAACWAVTNYLYVYALGRIAAADVTAIFSSNTAFIYVFSWLWLHERLVLLPVRSVSVLMSIGGMVLISYSDGFEGSTALGVGFSIGAAIGSAIYKVLFKRYIGNATSGQVSLFLSVLGIFNILFLWPFILIFYYTEVESWSFDTIPWDYLCGSAALSVAFNFLINFGIAVTFPLFIALGTVLGIPLNAVVDLVFRGTNFSNFKIGGSVLVIVGFLIMLIPEPLQQKVACWTEGSCSWERRRAARYNATGLDSECNDSKKGTDSDTKPQTSDAEVQADLPSV